MKKLNVIVFANENEFGEHASRICGTLSDLPEKQIFLGSWGEIQENDQEVIAAISVAVNACIASDKEQIFFGCCAKDYETILAAINAQDCELVKRSCQDIRLV